MKRTLYLANLAVALIVLPVSYRLLAQGAGTMQTIYSFEAPPGAAYPEAGPIVSESGALYGTTSSGGTTTACGYFNCGTVYELTRPASPGGVWTPTLYSFGVDPNPHTPSAGLVLGASGALYGWAAGGTSNISEVFELTPPVSPGGPWAETTLYSFKGPPSDGGSPVGGLAMGENGSLYGATEAGGTYNDGTVFELTPPASPGGAWTLTVVYNFRGDGDGIQPGGGVIVGGKGEIYGTTQNGGSLGYGTVFGIALVDGVWEEKVLLSLNNNLIGPFGLALGHHGVLYGQNENSIFQATPPASAGDAWTVQTLYAGEQYTYQQSLALGANGAIYWTTSTGGTSTACGVSRGCGTLNELLPPAAPGDAWTPVVLHNFTGQQGDGFQPNGGLVVTKDGAVYGTTYYGGGNFFGTVFRYTP